MVLETETEPSNRAIAEALNADAGVGDADDGLDDDRAPPRALGRRDASRSRRHDRVAFLAVGPGFG